MLMDAIVNRDERNGRWVGVELVRTPRRQRKGEIFCPAKLCYCARFSIADDEDQPFMETQQSELSPRQQRRTSAVSTDENVISPLQVTGTISYTKRSQGLRFQGSSNNLTLHMTIQHACY